jgi:hypothetical protein
MAAASNARRITGWIILGLVVATMAAASYFKLVGPPPKSMQESLQKWGLYEQIKLIGVLELGSAILLLIPRTSSLGILLASAFWGGAICIHLAFREIEGLIRATLLALTWIGAYLRDPAVLASFRSSRPLNGNPRVPRE